MTRREFPRSVKVAVVKRAMRRGVLCCEKCGFQVKKFQIDHIIADAIGGEPVISNAELICEVCYGIKNPQDTKLAAKAKRREAKSLGVRKPTQNPIPQRPKEEKAPSGKLPVPERRNLYERI
jgi:5-methylcytosine-specific restriction enzyme A